jgi:cytochrome bd-type quinol oxidase subunit 2
MITESSIYWILKLDDIQNIFIFLMVVFIMFSILTTSLYLINALDSSFDKRLADAVKPWWILCMVCTFISVITFCLIPSTKQMAMIKVIPTIANSEIVGEMSTDAKELYRMGINAIKEQLTGNKKEEEK